MGRAQKVALVLSGGGAKGIAHVGVIKALEENNIPIDYIVGTSMGGIVAGSYAAGLSSDELEEIMESKELSQWVGGVLKKKYDYFYNKEKPNAAFLSLKLSLDSTFNASLTSSIASDLSLNFALAEILAQPSANANYNFDSLFIPTRIVAADIFTQNEVVLKSGSLSHALRATLSVPFFYRPIRIDGKYLFDGGIYNNFPVDVAIDEFEPDVVIGVNVSSKIFNDYPFEKDEELLNNSLLYMLLDKTDPEIIPESGVYVEPNLKGYTAFDFNRAKALIDSGYVATLQQMDKIKAGIERRSSCDSLANKRNRFFEKNIPLKFTDINFHGFNSKQRKYISRIFKFNKGEPLYIEDIKTGYFRLVSEKYFRTIYPDITFNAESNSYQLEIFGRPRNNFNVEIGGNIATRNVSQIFLGLEYYYFNNYLLKNSLNFYTGSFYKSAQAKSRLDLPIFNQLYLEAEVTYNNWDFIDADDILKEENTSTVLVSTDRKYGFNIGFPVGAQFKGIINTAWINNTDRFSNTAIFTSADTLDVFDIRGLRTGLSFSRNSLNRKQYSNEGKAFNISLDYFNIEEEYEPGSTSSIENKSTNDHDWFRAKATVEQYFRNGNFSSGYFFEGVLSNQPFFSNYYSTIVNAPAFNPLQDSRTLFLENFRAHNYLAVGLRNVISIRPNLDFRLEGYAFKPLEAIKQQDDQQPRYDEVIDEIYFVGSASTVLHSPIGPISFSVNYYDDAQTQFGALLHVGFLLFQDKSMD
ncbi:patatin-like phospholipase family protein [Fulvivirga ulvae]|uniref:patatin-like phospholipase family protein n=1 Tax=Fulvivirga ulvae TaxID=2904245 RepID=UPI001F3B2F33|nr:patatin-like phospholipase family protein [Fulvivirga ulvae]UII34089.1 patatin-like phospholipase family protein [Fulvivirga ulvae]